MRKMIAGRLVALACAAAGVAVGGIPAGAQAAWPDQPINMIIAYAPGGGTDIAARVMIPFMPQTVQ